MSVGPERAREDLRDDEAARDAVAALRSRFAFAQLLREIPADAPVDA